MGVLSILADDIASFGRGAKRLGTAIKDAFASKPRVKSMPALSRVRTQQIAGDLGYELGGINYGNNVLQKGLSGSSTGIFDTVDDMAESVADDFANLMGEEVKTVRTAAESAYPSYAKLDAADAIERRAKGLARMKTQEPVKSTGVNAKEISESAMRDTGYGMTSEEIALMKHKSNYLADLRKEGENTRARNLGEKINEGTNSNTPLQPGQTGLQTSSPKVTAETQTNAGNSIDNDLTTHEITQNTVEAANNSAKAEAAKQSQSGLLSGLANTVAENVNAKTVSGVGAGGFAAIALGENTNAELEAARKGVQQLDMIYR